MDNASKETNEILIKLSFSEINRPVKCKIFNLPGFCPFTGRQARRPGLFNRAAVANGHVVRNAEAIYGDPFRQEAQLFVGAGPALFRDVSALAGPYFQQKRVGRGLAWADFNNDGKPDLVFSHNGGRPALLRNDTATENHWLRLELLGDGKKSNRNAIGARVQIKAGGHTQTLFLNGGGSYLSASERRLLAGLGPAERADEVTIFWPSGRRQHFQSLDANTWWRFHEEKAEPVRVTLASPQPS